MRTATLLKEQIKKITIKIWPKFTFDNAAHYSLYCRSASAGAYTSGLHTDNTLGTTRGRLEHTSTTTHSSRVTWCITEPKVAHRP